MQLFNRVMALVGFASVLGSLVGIALVGELGSGALGWVLELTTSLGRSTPLSF